MYSLRSIHALGILASGLLCACAGVDVKPIRTDEDDRCAYGFRYYEIAPFILVYSDGSEKLVSKLIHLPDLTRKMSIRPYQCLSGNTTELTFNEGVLTSAVQEGDGTKIPSAIIEAAKTAAVSAAALRKVTPDSVDSPESFEIPLPQLFRLHVDGVQTHLEAAGYENISVFVDVPRREK